MGSDPSVLLGRLAAGLATGLPLAPALDLLVDGLGLQSAVLRRTTDGASELLAVAGEVVHAVPAMREATAPLRPSGVVDLPVPGPSGPSGREAARLTVVGARPSQLPVLRAAAGVVGLALAGTAASGTGVAALLLDAEDDGDTLADALHDGPVQALVAARYACDAAVRGGDPALARDGVQEALVGLRRTMWHLRPRGGAGLADALEALAARLAEADGAPLLLALDDDAASRLDAPARALAYRLVQSVARDAPGPVRVALHGPDGSTAGVRLDVDGGRALDGPDRWRRRLRALGGDLSSSAGRLRLHLPATAPPRTTPTSPPAPHDTKACS